MNRHPTGRVYVRPSRCRRPAWTVVAMAQWARRKVAPYPGEPASAEELGLAAMHRASIQEPGIPENQRAARLDSARRHLAHLRDRRRREGIYTPPPGPLAVAAARHPFHHASFAVLFGGSRRKAVFGTAAAAEARAKAYARRSGNEATIQVHGQSRDPRHMETCDMVARVDRHGFTWLTCAGGFYL